MSKSFLHSNRDLRSAISSGLFAMLFIILLAGDIWVWRGSMLGELAVWVKEEGGEQAFWAAAVFYGLIPLLAFVVTWFDARWFRWLIFSIALLLLLSIIAKTISGLAEFNEVGWYFFVLFVIETMISAGVAWFAFHWARLKDD